MRRSNGIAFRMLLRTLSTLLGVIVLLFGMLVTAFPEMAETLVEKNIFLSFLFNHGISPQNIVKSNNVGDSLYLDFTKNMQSTRFITHGLVISFIGFLLIFGGEQLIFCARKTKIFIGAIITILFAWYSLLLAFSLMLPFWLSTYKAKPKLNFSEEEELYYSYRWGSKRSTLSFPKRDMSFIMSILASLIATVIWSGITVNLANYLATLSTT